MSVGPGQSTSCAHCVVPDYFAVCNQIDESDMELVNIGEVLYCAREDGTGTVG